MFVDLTSYAVQMIWPVTHGKMHTPRPSSITTTLCHCTLHDLLTKNMFTHMRILVLYSPICNSHNQHFTLPTLIFPPFTHSGPSTKSHEWYKHTPYSNHKTKALSFMLHQNDKKIERVISTKMLSTHLAQVTDQWQALQNCGINLQNTYNVDKFSTDNTHELVVCLVKQRFNQLISNSTTSKTPLLWHTTYMVNITFDSLLL